MQSYMATGSLCELETQIEIAARLGFLPAEETAVLAQANEVGRMLFGRRQSFQAKA